MVHVGNSRYYTPMGLANFVVSLLPEIRPQSVVDICCGSWNLLSATRRRWGGVTVTGVDMDPQSALHQVGDGTFHLMDGRLCALKWLQTGRTFDLVVANPPFGKTKERYLQHGLHEVFTPQITLRGYAVGRIETEMILANAALVRPGGCFLAIVPNTVVEASSFKDFRTILAGHFNLTSVVMLPTNTFPGAEVRSCVLVLVRTDKVPPTETSIWFSARCSSKGRWSQRKIGVVPRSSVTCGDWAISKPPIREFGAEVATFRGRISSNQFLQSDCGVPVLHTAARPPVGTAWNPAIRSTAATSVTPGYPTVVEGDILLSRIGKSAGYWQLYSGPEHLISDCLLVLRGENPKVLTKFLEEHSQDGCLKHLVRGVATQYIAGEDIHRWLGISPARSPTESPLVARHE